jgi:hypothetical protein
MEVRGQGLCCWKCRSDLTGGVNTSTCAGAFGCRTKSPGAHRAAGLAGQATVPLARCSVMTTLVVTTTLMITTTSVDDGHHLDVIGGNDMSLLSGGGSIGPGERAGGAYQPNDALSGDDSAAASLMTTW